MMAWREEDVKLMVKFLALVTGWIIPWDKEYRKEKDDELSFWEAEVHMGHSSRNIQQVVGNKSLIFRG